MLPLGVPRSCPVRPSAPPWISPGFGRRSGSSRVASAAVGLGEDRVRVVADGLVLAGVVEAHDQGRVVVVHGSPIRCGCRPLLGRLCWVTPNVFAPTSVGICDYITKEISCASVWWTNGALRCGFDGGEKLFTALDEVFKLTKTW